MILTFHVPLLVSSQGLQSWAKGWPLFFQFFAQSCPHDGRSLTGHRLSGFTNLRHTKKYHIVPVRWSVEVHEMSKSS